MFEQWIIFTTDQEKNTTNYILKERKQKLVKSIVDQLDSLHENDPKLIWKTIDELKKDIKTQENPISLSSWTTYFKELYDDKTVQLDLSQLEENNLNIKDLDYAFTCKEVKDSIKKLKKNKQPGIDLIHNEFLIYGKNVLLLPIVNLFNRVLSSGVLPDTWNISYILFLHKNCDIYNCNNYRCLSLAICLCKLFTSLLQRRLHTYIVYGKQWFI